MNSWADDGSPMPVKFLPDNSPLAKAAENRSHGAASVV